MEKSKKLKVFLIAGICLILASLAVVLCLNSGITNVSSTKADTTNAKSDSTVGTVKVKYVDTEGKNIAEPETQTGKIGEWYTTSRKDITAYKAFGDEPLNKKGYYSEDEIVVEYVYQNYTSVQSAVVGEENDITVSVENERALREYDLYVQTVSGNKKVSGAGIKVSKDSTEIKNSVSTNGEVYVGTVTVRDESESTYSIETIGTVNGYLSKLSSRFDVKVIRKWNESKKKFEITLDYDKNAVGVLKVEVNDKNQIIITLDYEEVFANYSINLETKDLSTQEAIFGAKFEVKGLNSSFNKQVEMSNSVENVGKFEISSETDEIEYYEIKQIEASNGYSQILDKEIVIGVKKIYNSEEKKYDIKVLYDNSLGNVIVSIDENGVITVVISFVRDSDQDLAISYYLTKINDEDIQSREPDITKGLNNIIEKEDFVSVKNSDKLNFTARVYNNSKSDTNGGIVKITLPKGLIFDLNNPINQANGWKAYIEYEYGTLEETQDMSLANVIVSENLVNQNIKGINNDKISYLDLQVVLTVTDSNIKNKRNIIDIAQIVSVYRDSNLDNNLSFEYLYVKYFDLSITKFIEKIDITTNGKTKTRNIGYDNKDSLPKIDVKAKQLKNTKLKITYGFKVENIGELAGLALEITDFLPRGFTFNGYENPDWYLDGDVLKTSCLNTTWLNPSESKMIYLTLEWKLDEEHLGEKRNNAKISNYYGDGESTDVTEDNQSGSSMIVSVSTGAIVYTGIIATMSALIAIGIVILKKYGRKE